ncbi:hypothetical protein PFISCL1PPCAC_9540, partial [Pristionchus fissidentatus]
LSDDGDEDILKEPSEEENERDEVEEAHPRGKSVQTVVENVHPTLLRRGHVHREQRGGEVVEHSVESLGVSRHVQLDALHVIWTLVSTWNADRAHRVRNRQVLDRDVLGIRAWHDTVVVHPSKQLHAHDGIQCHEEREEDGYVLNLLRGTLDDLLDSVLG